MRKRFINIKKLNGTWPSDKLILKGKELNEMPCFENAFIECDNGIITHIGTMNDMPGEFSGDITDCNFAEVVPAFVDSHTHLVFAATREKEFVDKINGLSYEAIAAKGGGILNSANKLAATPHDVLVVQALQRLNEIQKQGTATVEIKSGYGLSLEAELKMLRVIRDLKKLTPLNIKATFLGAHAIPMAYKQDREGYIKLIINEMLPAVANENLADYVDVFCEQGFFTNEETERIIVAASKFGLKPKIHANQLSNSGAVQTAVKCNAISVDHLEQMDDETIQCLTDSKTIPVVLPTAAFFLRLPYPPARRMIEAGLPVTLATDFNPGSSPNGRMSFAISLACIQMRMTPNEAINAASLNGAAALELSDKTGSISAGKEASFIILKQDCNINHIPYFFGKDVIDKVVVKGILSN